MINIIKLKPAGSFSGAYGRFVFKGKNLYFNLLICTTA